MNQLATITSRGQVTIPALFRKKTGLTKKRRVLISIQPDESLVISPVKVKSVLSLYQIVEPGDKSPDPKIARRVAYRKRAEQIANSGS